MKLKNLLLAGTVLLLPVSCTKEIIIKSGEETKVPTSLEVIVKTDQDFTSRADYDSNFPSNAVEHAEKSIYNMVIVVFDDRQLLETYKIASYYQESTGQVITNPTGEFVFTFTQYEAQPITTGVHYFYVVCNVPKPLLERESLFNQKGLSITDFERQVLYRPSNL